MGTLAQVCREWALAHWGNPCFSSGKLWFFLLENVVFLRKAFFVLVHLHCKDLFAFSRPVEINYFLFASTLVHQIAESIYCDPRARGPPCIVGIFVFLGSGRKVKFVIFPLPPPFAAQKTSWNIYYSFREGVRS